MKVDLHSDCFLINRGEIHLWIARLIATEDRFRALLDMCSPDEKQRADAFRFENLKESFIVGRGLLRSILGFYLGQRPEHIHFQYGTKGKPLLPSVPEQTLHFNLAHSEDLVIYAISRDCELGVDVECLREVSDPIGIAKHFFAKPEYLDLLRLLPVQRTEGFFNCWTRKEAFLKTVGDGLSVPLSEFQVSLVPDQPAEFRKFNDDRYRFSQWSLLHLRPATGYIGALAIPVSRCLVHERKFCTANTCLEYLEIHKR